MRVLEGRAKENDGKLKYVDISKAEKEVEVKEMKTLSEVIEGAKAKFPGLVHMRVPVCNSAAPLETDFDIICQTLVGTSINTPIIVNDQVGLSRATTGCVIACLFKEFQINASFEGLVETVPGVNLDLLKMDKYTMDPSKDALFRGEFPVVLDLISKLKAGMGAKNECDKVIDNIHKYYYLICFTAYMRDMAIEARSQKAEAEVTLPSSGKSAIPGNLLKLGKSFVDFMGANAALRDLVEAGKGNLQWERDIPPAALSNLEGLAKGDFQGNLGKIIHDIYQTAHQMFSDMPQGDHKKRAKYRFASKTLMRILPADKKKEVEDLIAKKTITLDLYEILGKCTWKPV